MRFEFWNAWMHLKLSSEKKSISMNLGSMIEQEEKRFVYRIRCSSNENNEEEEMEEGIGVSWTSECRWLLLEEPLRCFDGSAIWKTFSKFQLVEMKDNEQIWILGFVGSDLKKKWVSYGKMKNWEWRFRESNGGFWFLISKFEFIGAGTRCNRLQNLVIDYTFPDLL